MCPERRILSTLAGADITMPRTPGGGPGARRRNRRVEFPLAESSGFLVRDANRAFQRLLEKRITGFGLKRGQWYFLRVLWTEDGLSQRELSARVGTMEPTTVIALRSMEKSGLDPPRAQRRRQAQGAGVAHAEGQAHAGRAAGGGARHHRRGRARRQPRRACAIPPRHRADDRRTSTGSRNSERERRLARSDRFRLRGARGVGLRVTLPRSPQGEGAHRCSLIICNSR